jgi:hypothetical protein
MVRNTGPGRPILRTTTRGQGNQDFFPFSLEWF